ncbi:hypothetical protein L593_08090 [Salinarchaeum sp. Harcht-Bsk1]|uniref:hypothetical protein n=1 Tax=Salinarchaeum sp. Harcht-Bsk1 TaxID=1333523 RepID=UPI0003424246|nr:hypothetical protein [Salinarchaeum sp. Harcht-Bsk1]AGN01563.1 hypothetical protein L593_08090 [Salinarchaeum sp. Harcht-Bsk1]
MHSVVELAGSLLAAVAFTLAGLFVELQSVLSFAGGEMSTGTWFAVLGMLLLYAGVYLLGYERVVAQHVATAE